MPDLKDVVPVGIAYQCWAARQSTGRIYPDGRVIQLTHPEEGEVSELSDNLSWLPTSSWASQATAFVAAQYSLGYVAVDCLITEEQGELPCRLSQ